MSLYFKKIFSVTRQSQKRVHEKEYYTYKKLKGQLPCKLLLMLNQLSYGPKIPFILKQFITIILRTQLVGRKLNKDTHTQKKKKSTQNGLSL